MVKRTDFISRFSVMQEISVCIESGFQNGSEIDWDSMEQDLREDFADKITTLHNQGVCKTDGSDLIRDASEMIERDNKIRDCRVQRLVRNIREQVHNSPVYKWKAFHEELCNDSSFAIGILSYIGVSKSDGSDLIKEAALSEAENTRVTTVNRMQALILEEVRNAGGNMVLFSPVSEQIRKRNALAIGMLSELNKSDIDGSDLIKEAIETLKSSKLVFTKNLEVLPGRLGVYITG